MKNISIDETIGIREFMNNYLGVTYENEGHITHEKMIKYLFERGYVLPSRVGLDTITKEDIINGEYLLVRAESKRYDNQHAKTKKTKVIPYKNPLKIKEMKARENLQKESDVENLRKIRNAILKEENLIEDEFGDIVSLYEYNLMHTDYKVTEHVNRIRYVKQKGR